MRSVTTRRRGYALMLVLVFLVLFLMFLGVAYRQVGLLLRVESVRTLRTHRDEAATRALARAMSLLETGLPPANPYTCRVVIDTPSGPCPLTVTFTSDDGSTWLVRSAPGAPGQPAIPMPDTFAEPP
jgi:Tfp pilus assembly protein PilX